MELYLGKNLNTCPPCQVTSNQRPISQAVLMLSALGASMVLNRSTVFLSLFHSKSVDIAMRRRLKSYFYIIWAPLNVLN